MKNKMKTRKTTQFTGSLYRKCDGKPILYQRVRKTFFESRVFTMGWSGYLKHKCFFLGFVYMKSGLNTELFQRTWKVQKIHFI